jgi:predicted permease
MSSLQEFLTSLAFVILLLLFVGIPILAIAITGYVLAKVKVFGSPEALVYLNNFVFFLAIPCTVFRGLAIQNWLILDWRFVFVFLTLRVIVGVLCLLATWPVQQFHRLWLKIRQGEDDEEANNAVRGKQNDNDDEYSRSDFIGHLLTHYIATTWINTIIYGIPIILVLYGIESIVWNIMAAMSSLFFQLPVMLVCFEIRKIRQRRRERRFTNRQVMPLESVTEFNGDGEAALTSSLDEDDTLHTLHRHIVVATLSQRDLVDASTSVGALPTQIAPPPALLESAADIEHDPSHVALPQNGEEEEGDSASRQENMTAVVTPVTEYSLAKDIVESTRSVLLGVISNPPMLGIMLGLAYSFFITTPLQYFYGVDLPLFPPLNFFTLWLGSCVTPVATFTVGLFMHSRMGVLWSVWPQQIVYLTIKLLFIPLLTLPIGIAFGLDGQALRAAVLIAALPIAMASFTLSKIYKVGESIMTGGIIAGTFLMIPALIFWIVCFELYFYVMGGSSPLVPVAAAGGDGWVIVQLASAKAQSILQVYFSGKWTG